MAGGSSFIEAATASARRMTRSTLPPASLARSCVAPAAADQLGEQQGIAADAVHARRRALDVDPVEVAAEADMVMARDLDDMLDMVGDQTDVRCRARVRLLPFVELRLPDVRLADVEVAKPRRFGRFLRRPLSICAPTDGRGRS